MPRMMWNDSSENLKLTWHTEREEDKTAFNLPNKLVLMGNHCPGRVLRRQTLFKATVETHDFKGI